jgi:N-acetylmuramoyl-L-alanine amidase
MSRTSAWLVILLLTVMSLAHGAEIVLVYPRLLTGQTSFSYPASLDTSFALGHVTLAGGQLFINDAPVALTADGAFLTRLPLRKTGDHGSWDLSLRQDGQEIAALSFPFGIGTPAAPTPDSTSFQKYPCIVRVTQKNAHIWTGQGGTYFVFPEVGCALTAIGRESGLVRVCFGDESGLIEERSVAVDNDSTLAPAILGNGACSRDKASSICEFTLSRNVPWRTEVSAEGTQLDLTLYGVRSGTERIRYDIRDKFLQEIRWEQKGSNTVLHFICKRRIREGFAVDFGDNQLKVTIRNSFSTAGRGLKGKTIVIDPGHGGSAWGAVGPRGTREKDINLKLARLLADELDRRGAHALLTREVDEDPGLYERMNFAKLQHADFFLSLHCNALPDSQNPFLRHGSGTYYYQSVSRQAAEFIHRYLLKATGLRDDGLFYANLAAVRPTEFPAVLVETAYLIDPAEERLLLTDEFLKEVSHELTRGLREYFQSEP